MKKATTCLMVLIASVSVGLCEEGQLRVAAFNVQIFGVSKFSQPDVVSILSKVHVHSSLLHTHMLCTPLQIVRRYDVVLIQEIRDASQTVIASFLEVVNK